MVAPHSSTGLRCASGVSLPVRPTSHVTSSTTAVVSSAGNLYATAQRGNFSVSPSASRMANDVTLTTMPSMRKSSAPRVRSTSAMPKSSSSSLVQ